MNEGQSTARDYAIHEAGHAVVAHMCGFEVLRLRIAPERCRGVCEIDRGFDPDEACAYVRENPKEPRSTELLAKLKRDLAGRLAGIVSDDMCDVQGNEEEYKRDEECADKLARVIIHTSWARSVPRPPFSERERGADYRNRARHFLRAHILEPRRLIVESLAWELERTRDMATSQINDVFERQFLPFNSITDEELP